MTEPTERDQANEAARRAIADKQNALYRHVLQLAWRNVGWGYKPWMKLTAIDIDFRRDPGIKPVAVVYQVYRGRQTMENVVFIREREDGTVQQAKTYEELFGDLLTEPHPTRTIEIGGKTVHPGRYELHFGSLEKYHVRSASSLAKSREKREARQVLIDAAENPLFADVIKQEAKGRRID